MTPSPFHLPFFVYGTLLPGQPNYDVWRSEIVDTRPAEIAGCRLFDLGYYPLLVDSPGGAARGLVVTLAPTNYDAIVAVLDRLEGIDASAHGLSIYRRERRIVCLAGGEAVVAWVYIGDSRFASGLLPLEGDWKSYWRRQLRRARSDGFRGGSWSAGWE